MRTLLVTLIALMLLAPAWAGGESCKAEKAAGKACTMSAEKQAGQSCPMSAAKQAAKGDCCAAKAQKSAAADGCSKSAAKAECQGKAAQAEGWFAAKTGCARCAAMTSR